MSFVKSTGLGIKSTDPRFWVPQPAKSVIMSKARFQAFMGATGVQSAMQPSFTPMVPAGSFRQGLVKASPTLSTLG